MNKLILKITPLIILSIFITCFNIKNTRDKYILSTEIVQAYQKDTGNISAKDIIEDECRKLQEEKIESYKELKIIRDQEYIKLQELKIAEEAQKKQEEEKVKKTTPAPKPQPQSKPKAPSSNSNTQQAQGAKSEPNTNTATNSASAGQAKYPVEYLTAIENQIVALCNNERAKVSAPPLQINETLRKVARYKSNEMLQNNYFSHSSPVTGYMPWDLAKKNFGYSYSTFGENLWMSKMSSEDAKYTEQFRATITAAQIVKDWMNSPGHKANILNKNFRRIGVGLAFSSKNKAYSAQEFSN
ncbi:SCP-like protein [Clostridiales bacterium oral taxon 876 str. F0540]|nr:SCP-like protein [Clostridiales bacterium oral taxon 876 str. F0540]